MGQIHDLVFAEKKQLAEFVGRKITCKECGQENEIEDVLQLIPTEYLVTTANNINKAKSNQEMSNWLKQ